jgi:hypothetical protein
MSKTAKSTMWIAISFAARRCLCCMTTQLAELAPFDHAQRTRISFCPLRWPLSHLGLYQLEFEFEGRFHATYYQQPEPSTTCWAILEFHFALFEEW